MNIVKNINRDIKIIKTDFDNLFPSEYNLFLSSEKFWNFLSGEKILIYQEDTIILKNNIDDFLEWDYIGAPWNKNQNDTPNCVGNGGLSLRTKSIMLKIISKIDIYKTKYNSSTLQYIQNSRLDCPPEDVYFSKNIQELNIGRVANFESAYNFSSESIINENSFGLHGIGICANHNKLIYKLLYENVVHTYNVLNTYNLTTEHRGGWNIVKQGLNNFVNTYSDILFIDGVEAHFLWDDKTVIDKKWFGFIHLTPITPAYLYNILNLHYLFELDIFKSSLKNCLFLLTLSSYITEFLKQKLNECGLNIRVITILHPTDMVCPKFTLDNYNNNSNKHIIQIGQQLRKVTSIFRLNTKLNRIWLTGFKDMNRIKNILLNEAKVFNYKDINYDIVDMKYLNSFDEYDKLLSKNIVFIDLFDAGANNTVVECIARNTPIIVNKIPGVVEYLGEEYPLYFTNLDNIDSLLTYENIEKTYYYLKNLNKEFLDVNNFVKKFINVINKEITKSKGLIN